MDKRTRGLGGKKIGKKKNFAMKYLRECEILFPDAKKTMAIPGR